MKILGATLKTMWRHNRLFFIIILQWFQIS